MTTNAPPAPPPFFAPDHQGKADPTHRGTPDAAGLETKLDATPALSVPLPASVFLDRVPENHEIPQVSIWWSYKEQPDVFNSSFRLFSALFSANGQVLAASEAGRSMTADAVAALNAFLSHHQGRADLHWRRMGCPAPLSRWGWSAFKDSIGLTFQR